MAVEEVVGDLGVGEPSREREELIGLRRPQAHVRTVEDGPEHDLATVACPLPRHQHLAARWSSPRAGLGRAPELAPRWTWPRAGARCALDKAQKPYDHACVLV
jgi:hypothetical protein